MHFVGDLGAISGELTVGWISSFAFARDVHVRTRVSILVWQGQRGERRSLPGQLFSTCQPWKFMELIGVRRQNPQLFTDTPILHPCHQSQHTTTPSLQYHALFLQFAHPKKKSWAARTNKARAGPCQRHAEPVTCRWLTGCRRGPLLHWGLVPPESVSGQGTGVGF